MVDDYAYVVWDGLADAMEEHYSVHGKCGIMSFLHDPLPDEVRPHRHLLFGFLPLDWPKMRFVALHYLNSSNGYRGQDFTHPCIRRVENLGERVFQIMVSETINIVNLETREVDSGFLIMEIPLSGVSLNKIPAQRKCKLACAACKATPILVLQLP